VWRCCTAFHVDRCLAEENTNESRLLLERLCMKNMPLGRKNNSMSSKAKSLLYANECLDRGYLQGRNQQQEQIKEAIDRSIAANQTRRRSSRAPTQCLPPHHIATHSICRRTSSIHAVQPCGSVSKDRWQFWSRSKEIYLKRQPEYEDSPPHLQLSISLFRRLTQSSSPKSNPWLVFWFWTSNFVLRLPENLDEGHMLFVWPGAKLPVNMPPLLLQASLTHALASLLSRLQPPAKHLAIATSALMEAITARATVAEIFMVGAVIESRSCGILRSIWRLKLFDVGG
jgi:hypothetical protein